MIPAHSIDLCRGTLHVPIPSANLKNRCSIRLKNYDYSQSGTYFITICTHNRQCLFGDIVNTEMALNATGKIAHQQWLKTKDLRDDVTLDEFVIMPNHIHGIIVIDREGARSEPLQGKRDMFGKPTSNAIACIIRGYKGTVTKILKTQQISTAISPIWQRNYYEHIIRDEAAYFKIREYIINNPITWQNDKYYEPNVLPDSYVEIR